MPRGKKALSEADHLMAIQITVTRGYEAPDPDELTRHVCALAKCGLGWSIYVRAEAACGVVASALSCENHADRVSFILRHLTAPEIVQTTPEGKRARLVEVCRKQAAEAAAIAAELSTNPRAIDDSFLERHRLPKTMGAARQITRLVYRSLSLEWVAQLAEYTLGRQSKVSPMVEALITGAM